MFTLTITEPAARLIRAELKRCAIRKPAVCLLEARDGIPFKEELERAGASEKVQREMEELATRYPHERRGDFKLVPCIYPRMRFLGLFLVEISGIVFFFPPDLRKKAAGGTLDVGCGALVLLDRTGRVVMPRATLY
jgi:hypothetical protein